MDTRRELIASLLATVLGVAALAAFPAAWVAIPAGIALVIALPLLARSAIRLAGTPTQGHMTRPRHD